MAEPISSRPEYLFQTECDIPLTTETPEALIATVRFFSGVITKAAGISDEGNILLSIRACPSIDPGGVLIVQYAISQLAKLGFSPYLFCAPGQVYDLLKDSLRHYQLPKRLRKLVLKQDGDYLLRGIKSKVEMVGELEEWASTVKHGSMVDAEQVALWATQVAEVAANSFQHGKEGAEQILIAGRAYKERGVVQLATLDLGQGIPSVLGAVSRPKSGRCGDGDIIAHAFKNGVTSKCVRENQGRGLYTLAQTVKKGPERGNIQVLSSNGFVHISKSKKSVRSLKPPAGAARLLQGTLTVIHLGFQR